MFYFSSEILAKSSYAVNPRLNKVYVCIHACMHACMHVHACMYVCMYVCRHVDLN